jgi:hypothetical protein
MFRHGQIHLPPFEAQVFTKTNHHHYVSLYQFQSHLSTRPLSAAPALHRVSSTAIEKSRSSWSGFSFEINIKNKRKHLPEIGKASSETAAPYFFSSSSMTPWGGL